MYCTDAVFIVFGGEDVSPIQAKRQSLIIRNSLSLEALASALPRLRFSPLHQPPTPQPTCSISTAPIPDAAWHVSALAPYSTCNLHNRHDLATPAGACDILVKGARLLHIFHRCRLSTASGTPIAVVLDTLGVGEDEDEVVE